MEHSIKNTEINEWYCEEHPEFIMGHNSCKGAGIPSIARMEMLVLQRRNALQDLKETKVFYENVIYELLYRLNELESIKITPSS